MCKWTYDNEYGSHDTECGEGIIWNDGEIPIDIKFCPYCGKKIET